MTAEDLWQLLQDKLREEGRRLCDLPPPSESLCGGHQPLAGLVVHAGRMPPVAPTGCVWHPIEKADDAWVLRKHWRPGDGPPRHPAPATVLWNGWAP